MRIRQRITSRSSQTDIIVFDTFRDEVTGFSIAWLLTQIDNSYVKTAVFSAKEREGYPPVPKAVDLNTPSPRDIITSWKEKNVKTVAVSAAYKQVQITIQLLFDQHLCSFEYEKDKFNYALELAKKFHSIFKRCRFNRNRKSVAAFFPNISADF